MVQSNEVYPPPIANKVAGLTSLGRAADKRYSLARRDNMSMDLLAGLVTSFAVGAGTFAAFKAIEEKASADAKAALSAWLSDSDFTRDRRATIHDVLLTTYMSYFSGHFTKRFVAYSVALSLAGPMILLLLGLTTITTRNLINAKPWEEGLIKVLDPELAIALIGCGILSAPADYISLLKSSLILRASDFRENVLKYYALDLIISIALAATWSVAVGVTVLKTYGLIPSPITNSGVSMVFSVFFTTLIPTLFAFSFVVSSFLAKLLATIALPLQYTKSKALYILDIKVKPFQSVGLLLCLVAAIVTLCVVLNAG